ncbi:MAG TPA: hypothetical protein VHN80_18295 [Kineosporiaceae bacterium]|nr:hypothetical protein [Kineosporiaceae bacterium]
MIDVHRGHRDAVPGADLVGGPLIEQPALDPGVGAQQQDRVVGSPPRLVQTDHPGASRGSRWSEWSR